MAMAVPASRVDMAATVAAQAATVIMAAMEETAEI